MLVRVEIVLGNFGIGTTDVFRFLVQVTFCDFLLYMLHGFSQSLGFIFVHMYNGRSRKSL